MAEGSFEATLEKHYPGTLNAPELVSQTTAWVEELGHTPKDTKPAFWLCRDDSIEDLRKGLNDAGYMPAFNAHTLAGHSLTAGKTSVGAWYHHFADHGMGVMYFGPHIGINSQGELGKLDREGRSKPGPSCGANAGMAAAFEAGDMGPYDDDLELSHAASWLMNDETAKEAIMAAPVGGERMHVMAEHEYRLGVDMLLSRVLKFQATEEHQNPILFIGGVNIDSRHDDHNRFQIRDVYVINNGEVEQTLRKYNAE